jgi:hypothetical protein
MAELPDHAHLVAVTAQEIDHAPLAYQVASADEDKASPRRPEKTFDPRGHICVRASNMALRTRAPASVDAMSW